MTENQHSTVLSGATVDHIRFIVSDIRVADDLVTQYGLEVDAMSESPSLSVVLRSGAIRLVLSQPGDDPAARAYLELHGDGVADIALAVPNVQDAFVDAVAHGAGAVRGPSTDEGITTAVLEGFGDVVHTLVQRAEGAPFLPGMTAPDGAPVAISTGLHTIDHLAVCLESGGLRPAVEYYSRALGFRSIFAEQIQVGPQAMNSEVVQSASGAIVLTLIEPEPTAVPGQIDEFLKNHQGPGVQHVALATDDIVTTVRDMQSRGVAFLNTPGAYYDELPARMEVENHTVAAMRELGVLADVDQGGELFQIFAQSTHPARTFFFEIIERDGASTFGSNNIRALYAAVARVN